MDHPIPTRTASTDTVTSILSRSGYKGKGRGSRVSFAPEVDERSPLLSKYADNVEGRDEESGYTEESNNGESSSLPSRLHRKLKKGLLVGRGSMRKSGYGLPYYPGDDMDDTETSKVMLYATCFFILICVIVGAGVLVQSAGRQFSSPHFTTFWYIDEFTSSAHIIQIRTLSHWTISAAANAIPESAIS